MPRADQDRLDVAVSQAATTVARAFKPPTSMSHLHANIDSSLHRALRVYAASAGTSLVETIEKALTEFLQKRNVKI